MKKMMADWGQDSDGDEEEVEEVKTEQKESVQVIDEVLSTDDEGDEEYVEEVVESDYEEEVVEE